MSSLEGKTAVITGAGRGLGSYLSGYLKKQGAKVVKFDLDISEEEKNPNYLIIKGDVTAEHDVRACCKSAVDVFGPPQILITCAGVFGPSLPVQKVDVEDWRRVIEVNLTGTFLFVKEILPHMLKNEWGRIICFASTAGIANSPGVSAYNTSKAGVISLVRTVSQEIEIENVCINAVCPGNTDTPMTQSIERQKLSSGSGDRVAYHRNLRESGLYHQPEDINDLITFLAGEESSFITGQFIQLTPTRLRRI